MGKGFIWFLIVLFVLAVILSLVGDSVVIQ